jgi:hypothetical protein
LVNVSKGIVSAVVGDGCLIAALAGFSWGATSAAALNGLARIANATAIENVLLG